MSNKRIFAQKAYAKINLYLHVTKKRDDDYHDLDSLIAFTDFGDDVTVHVSDALTLALNGPFANALSQEEKTLERASKNILAQTLWALSDYAKKQPAFHITLTKNIPLGTGLGGGSADAAALARILCTLWDIDPDNKELQNILFKLGADVPLCFYAKPCRIINAGESILPAPSLPTLYAVLVHPNEHCSTASVFKSNQAYSSKDMTLPNEFPSITDIVTFLNMTQNDLTLAAQENIPAIKTILQTLKDQDSVRLARMSGSGSACFGVFETLALADNAAQAIKNLHPQWWIQAVQIS